MGRWTERDGALHLDVQLRDFAEAFAFMCRVALVAERMGHHPDWSTSWNRVSIRLTTHDAGGVVTERDRALAVAIDEILG